MIGTRIAPRPLPRHPACGPHWAVHLLAKHYCQIVNKHAELFESRKVACANVAAQAWIDEPRGFLRLAQVNGSQPTHRTGKLTRAARRLDSYSKRCAHGARILKETNNVSGSCQRAGRLLLVR